MLTFSFLLLSYILIFRTIAFWPFLENLVSLKSSLFYSCNINFFWVFKNLFVFFFVCLYIEIFLTPGDHFCEVRILSGLPCHQFGHYLMVTQNWSEVKYWMKTLKVDMYSCCWDWESVGPSCTCSVETLVAAKFSLPLHYITITLTWDKINLLKYQRDEQNCI